MKTFLQEVTERINKDQKSFEGLVFILPNKRAGLFLKKHIAFHIDKPIFSPIIHSIEELITEISGLEKASNFDLLLQLYEVFQPYLTEKEKDFDSFIAWGTTLLSDFNEIDRNLVSHAALFDYLTATQRLKNWGTDPKATPLISNTLKFWSQLKPVYETFQKKLLKKGLGHQGLIYKQAASNVNGYISDNGKKTYHFIGFNALNTAEEHIFQNFYDNGNAMFWWDIDSYFLNDTIHEAGFFIRNYMKRWPNISILSHTKSSFLAHEKRIKITGIPKSISQAKFASQAIKNSPTKNTTALVLSDETLLKPILNSLPENTSKVNVTMGLPLNKTPLFEFFDSLFNLYLNSTKNGWFFKEVVKLLSNPYSFELARSNSGNMATRLSNYIKEKNILFVNQEILEKEPFSKSLFLTKVFHQKEVSGGRFISICLNLILELKEIYQKSDNPIELHYLYGFSQLFKQLKDYVSAKPYLRSLKAVKPFFNELVSTEQIDFRGEPIGGLQIMGVLESRNLDFDSVIITSVNEGVLPAGKSQNSFIPFDIKKEFGLPTYKEKDAIYAYHFYRLLQRAKHIHILYNTEPDVLQGNEKSRFISQLLTDSNTTSKIIHDIAAPEINIEVAQPKFIQKTPRLLKCLIEKGEHGFSPSALTNYIRDPYSFYKNNVLGLNEVEDVEENIAHNTFGTIVHDSLEQLYVHLIGQKITPEGLTKLKKNTSAVVRQNFEKYFLPRDVEKGQNLIAFHVIQKYITTFIDLDSSRSKAHEIILIALEKSLKAKITIPEYPHQVFLRGKLDRLEQIDGRLQILDYKTGNVARSEVELIDLEESIANEKRSKAFQLLCYALMEHKQGGANNLIAGIVPIKKLSLGIVPFAQKKGPRGPKEHTIDRNLLSRFEEHLADLILEILNPEIPFKESESTSF
jgi:hypothetical protein